MSASPPGICRVRLLGPPTIHTSAGGISATKTFVFGAALYLGMRRGSPVGRAQLSALLWPDADDATRSERLRWLARQLRQAGLPTPTRTPQIELPVEQVLLDIVELETTTSLATVLSLAVGEPLQGYEPSISDRYAHWLDETRDAVRSRVIRVLSRWLADARRDGDWDGMEELSRRVIALDEFHEQASLALVEALVMQGRTDRAAQVLAHYRAELGLRPSTAALRQIEEQVRELVEAESSTVPRSALVGRADVLARLLDCVDPARPGNRRVVVAGPSGIGKSRMLEEFGVAARLRGTRVTRLTCMRADALRPLSLVLDLARRLLELRGALGASPEAVDVLRRFLGERGADADAAPPELKRAEVFGALRELIEALLDDGPVAVVADDVQWAEPGSWAVLAPLVAEHPAVVWVLGLRTESPDAASQTIARFLGEHDGETIWLAPLSTHDVATLCAARAMPRRIPPEILTVLAARAGGIPVVAEALVEHWFEIGDLATQPPSVTRLVTARLDRLSPPATRVLEAVAVLGADAEPMGVEAVSLLERAALLEAVRELDAAGVLRNVEGTFTAHALWTEAVLARVPQSALRLQHRYAAEWLEHLNALSALPDHRRHWAIALHWFEAQDPERARRGLDGAADVLGANGFFLEAAVMLERAQEIAGSSDAALHYGERAAVMYRRTADRTDADNIRRVHERYEATARVLLQDRYSPHHEVELELIGAIGRQSALRPESIRRATICALAPEAPVLHRLRAAHHVLQEHNMLPMDQDVVERVWRAVEALHPVTELERSASEHCAAHYYAASGDPARGLSHALAAHPALEDRALKFPTDYMNHLKIVSDLYEFDGDLVRAQQTRRELFAWGQRVRNPAAVELALSALVGTALEAGEIAEVRSLLPSFGRSPRGSPHIVDRARSIAWIVCALEEGNVELARQELDFTLAAADAEVHAMHRARVLAIFAHLALLEEDVAAIRSLLPRLLACFTGRYAYMDHPLRCGSVPSAYGRSGRGIRIREALHR